jgi:hypothetical protein
MIMQMKSGKTEGLPYSLSRWTDLPSSKWEWFKEQLAQGHMMAFDPRTAIPAQWSLRPEDTRGLIIWTKDPTNLLRDPAMLKGFPLVIHITLTGWTEVEKNAPTIQEGIRLFKETARAYGPENLVWRFTPVPILPTLDVLDRFTWIADSLSNVNVTRVYTSFIQENDRMTDDRDVRHRMWLLRAMARSVNFLGMQVLHCKDDKKTLSNPLWQLEPNLYEGTCEDGTRFGPVPEIMDCGCCHAVDPFTVNESCTMGCQYCYAADRAVSPKKHNTTLKVLP